MNAENTFIVAHALEETDQTQNQMINLEEIKAKTKEAQDRIRQQQEEEAIAKKKAEELEELKKIQAAKNSAKLYIDFATMEIEKAAAVGQSYVEIRIGVYDSYRAEHMVPLIVEALKEFSPNSVTRTEEYIDLYETNRYATPTYYNNQYISFSWH